MKKRISLILSLFMILSVFNINGLAENDNIACTEEALAVFSDIGLLTAEETGEANLNSLMTRAEFSNLVAKVLNMKYGSQEVLFSDIPADSFYLPSINSLVDAGIISVSDDLKFNPDNTIKFEEAVKMVVCAAGYTELANSKGGYPQGYVGIASETGILDDIKITDKNALTVGESLQILYNASTIGYYEKTLNGAGFTYEISEETLLSKYHDIYLQEGTVYAMNSASVDEGYEARADETNIDGLIYTDTKEFNENEYLGSFVEFVYRYDSINDIGEMIYMEKKYPDHEEVILSQNYIGFDSNSLTIEYYSNEAKTRKDTEKIAPGIAVTYNGRPYGGKIADVISKLNEDYNTGNIYLKDSDKDGTYDYMLINCYSTFVVTSYSDNTIHNKLNIGEKIDTEDYKNVQVRTEEGMSAVLSTAYPYVAQVAASDDFERLDIILPSGRVQGNLSEIGDDTISVSDTVLEVNEKYFADNSGLWKLNSQVTALLDSTGRVVYITEGVATGEFSIGYLLKSAYNADDEYLTFKLYDYTSGKIQVFSADEKITVDGIRYKSSEEANALLTAFPETSEADGKLKITPQLIRFKANEEKVINEIDTAALTDAENPEKTLYRIFTYANRQDLIGWSGGHGRFDTTILYDTNITKVISVPDLKNLDVDSVTEKDFGNTVPAELKGEKEKVLIPYKYDNSTLYTDILVYMGSLERKGEYAMMYISSGVGLSADDEVVNTVKVNELGTEKVYPLGEGIKIPEGVTEGDLVALTTNASGEIVGIERMYDREEAKYKDGAKPYGKYGDYIYNLPGYASTYAYRSVGKQLSRGYVYQKVGTNIQFTYEIGNAAFEGPGYEMINISGKPVVIYDSKAREGRRVYTGSVDDIIDYLSAGPECTYLLIASAGNILKGVYIYK